MPELDLDRELEDSWDEGNSDGCQLANARNSTIPVGPHEMD
jgi:hypothetical protein